jgi:hypothetical protein
MIVGKHVFDRTADLFKSWLDRRLQSAGVQQSKTPVAGTFILTWRGLILSKWNDRDSWVYHSRASLPVIAVDNNLVQLPPAAPSFFLVYVWSP